MTPKSTQITSYSCSPSMKYTWLPLIFNMITLTIENLTNPYLNIFFVIAAFILLIAAVNFMNLTTARVFLIDGKRLVYEKQ